MALLDIRNLKVEITSKNERFTLLDGVDITLEAGEIYALVGESGSGKSVILSIICGIMKDTWRVSADRFRFNNQEILKLNETKRRALIRENFSIIVQDPYTAFNPCQKIGVQLKRSIIFRDKWYRYFGSRKKKVIDILHKVGIKDHKLIMNSYPQELSKSNLQKVMIAGAIINNPKILIADEPRRLLDSKSAAQIDRLLMSLNKNLGTSILLASESFNSVIDFADKISFLYAGQMMETGKKEILRSQSLHPYTEIMKYSEQNFIGLKHKSLLNEVKGITPLLSKMPRGCRFAPRCVFAQKECVNKPLETKEKQHFFSCFYPLNTINIKKKKKKENKNTTRS